VGTRPDFHYAFAVWQHSTEGAPDGVAVPVDLDRIFVPLTPPATAARPGGGLTPRRRRKPPMIW
jgi:hypothetical protein